MGGLNAAVLLARAGISFTVIEKNADVGGTWFENRYPGARVDTLSRTYTHLFGAGYVYPNDYCGWEDNRRYLAWVADAFGVRDRIVFDTEVAACRWDDATATWTVEATGPDGPRTWTANAVFSAVGFLSRPVVPEIEGAGTFKGPSFHTARWPAGLDVAGKRIGVIGTGCTGYQTVPELALTAGHVHVFQRTPQWVFPVSGYRSPLPPEIPWLDRNLPFHVNFNRFRAQYLTGPEMGRVIYNVEPGFEDEHARSALNKQIRDACIAFVHEKLGDTRPELVEKMIPPHPPLSARPVVVDEEYSVLDALTRENVSLVTEGIRRITPAGIETLDGREIELDVIVYATGFNANAFLFPMEIRGRDGREIQELWAEDGPRAYLGCMMPGFPNLFVIYGPNTNPFGGGLGLVSHEEMVTRFGLRCIEHLVTSEHRSVDVTEEAYRRYNAELDEAEQLRLYSDPRANTYYRHTTGRSAANCPFGGDEMWRWLKEPDLAEVVLR
jgi:4-hydroxyacetophenone monooxygenase